MKNIYSFLFLLFASTSICTAQVSLTTMGTAYTQNFDVLSNTVASTTNALSLAGWSMTETGGGARDNEEYGVDNGASTTGDTYSYGTTSATDRALGELRSGTLIPNFGATFTNNTGSAITSLDISFTGEEWRLGTASRAITDSLNFQYSTNATSLTTGTWTNVAALNFTTPANTTVGAKDGNAAANRTALSTTITGLSIPDGATFWIRWIDFDATGADDGLAIDDFSLTPSGTTLPINLVSFSAIKDNQTSKLNWSAAQLLNNSFFIVERSANGINWQDIAKVNTIGNTQLNYSVTDATPISGTNFYRLKMVDVDNKITYSDIRQVNYNKDYSYSVYPNPAQEYILLTTDRPSDKSTFLQLINANGQAVIKKQILAGEQPFKVNVNTLARGSYFIRVITQDGKQTTLPFIKR